MPGIKHHTQTDESNDARYTFSETAWEEDHDVDDSSIAQAKVVPDIQVITGPGWADPNGSGPFVLQFNSGANKGRLCWYNGTVWSYIWGGNCRIEEFALASGTIGVRDIVSLSIDVWGTATPTAMQHNGPFMYSDRRGLGVALANCGTLGAVFPVLVSGRMQLVSNGVIEAGLVIVGDYAGKAVQLADQSVNESGFGAYTAYYSRHIGIALTRAGSANALFWALIGTN